MARTYAIQPGDSLRKIARDFYSDPELYMKLAKYNGIFDPNLIIVGQRIEVPSKEELEEENPGPAIIVSEIRPPQDLDGIIATFGDIRKYIKSDGRLSPKWESEYLANANLPFKIPIAWNPSRSVSKLYCHKKLVDIFPAVFEVIEKEKLKDKINSYGGCYSYRSKRSGTKPSTHSWGIAIDLNPRTNMMGTLGDMDPGIVEIFRKFGFKWGGDWSGRSKDPMHFQFCTGY